MDFGSIARAGAWVVGGIVLVLVSLYLLVVAINWHDEPPSAAVLQLERLHAGRPRVADASNAWVHALGIAATPASSPLELGRQRKMFLDGPSTTAHAARRLPGDEVAYRAARSKDVSELANRCGDPDDACLQLLRAYPERVANWLVSERWLLLRYRDMIALPHWVETVPGDFMAPLAGYEHALGGQTLHLLEAWQAARAGDAHAVRGLLQDDMRFWRNVLASSDLLITKMIATRAVQRNLGMGNLALRELPAAKQAAGMPPAWQEPLTTQERSLMRALAGEWRATRAAIASVGWTDRSQPATGLVARVVERIRMPLFKPQATGNLSAARFVQAGVASQAAYAELERSIRGVTQRERPTRTRLFNPIGRLLDQTIGDTYLHYAARPSDLEGLRRATVLAATVRRDGIAAEEMERVLRSSPVRNPYDGSAFDWDADAGSIVVRGLQRGEPGRKAVLL